MVVVAAWVVLLFVFAPLVPSSRTRRATTRRASCPRTRSPPGGRAHSRGRVPRGRDGQWPDRLPARGRADPRRQETIRDAFLVSSNVPVTKLPAVPFLTGSPPGLVRATGRSRTRSSPCPRTSTSSATGEEGQGRHRRRGGRPEDLPDGRPRFNIDADEIFNSIDAKLLATVLLVLILRGDLPLPDHRVHPAGGRLLRLQPLAGRRTSTPRAGPCRNQQHHLDHRRSRCSGWGPTTASCSCPGREHAPTRTSTTPCSGL